MLTRYEDAPKERQLTVARIAALAVMPSLTVDDLAEIMKMEREYHEKTQQPNRARRSCCATEEL